MKRRPPAPLPRLVAPPILAEPADAWEDAAEAMALVAVLAWPRDARRRAEAMATWAAVMLDLISHVLEPETLKAGLTLGAAQFAQRLGITVEEVLATPQAKRLFAAIRGPERTALVGDTLARGMETLFLPVGGFGAVAKAPGLKVVTAELRRAVAGPAALAGAVPEVVAAIERHHPDVPATVNRALAVLEGPGRSIRVMKDAWQEGRCAAHLWGALWVALGANRFWSGAGGEAVAEAIERRDGRARLLRHAAWFAGFAARYAPPGAGRPLIESAELIPIDATPEAPPIPPLPAELHERARRYRTVG
ncbi:MAG: hypothetical protein RMK90_11095 [Acetobacteraceae bacterium]|nr:hypothetical protein [Acetobacteraceae bacterium]